MSPWFSSALPPVTRRLVGDVGGVLGGQRGGEVEDFRPKVEVAAHQNLARAAEGKKTARAPLFLLPPLARCGERVKGLKGFFQLPVR